jgi:hypothetical protein
MFFVLFVVVFGDDVLLACRSLPCRQHLGWSSKHIRQGGTQKENMAGTWQLSTAGKVPTFD